MGNKRVFLDREYDVPDYLPELIDEYKKLNSYAAPLFEVLKNQMENQEYSSDVDSDFKVWKDAAKRVASKYIKKAEKKGIHDLSIWELVDSNKAIQPTGMLFTCHMTHHHITMNLLNAMNDWFDQYDAAYDKVGSNVKGPGFGILTNSLTSLLLYEVISYGAERKQFEQENEEFKRYIGKLNSTTNQKIDKNKAQYLALYYTYIREDIPEVVQEMLYIYLKKLDEHNLFDTMVYWDYPLDSLDKSNQVLEGYNTASNDLKKKILCDAFEQCPFNPEVFKNAVKDEFINKETLDTAKYLHQADGLKYILEEQLELAIRFDEINKIDGILSLIGYIDDSSMDETIVSELKPVVEEIKNKYFELKKIVETTEENGIKNNLLIKWVKKNITKELSEFVEVDDKKIEKKTKKSIEKIVSQDFYNFLLNHGIIDAKILACNENGDGLSVLDLNEKYAKKLADKICELRDYMVTQKVRLERARVDCANKKRVLQQKVDNLKNERDSLSIFKRKAKKIFNEQITSLYSKIDLLENEYELESLEKEYSW